MNSPYDKTILQPPSTKAPQINFCDWVSVNLQTQPNSEPVYSTSALLTTSGKIVNAYEPYDPVSFPYVENGYYYIAIKHRNHLLAASSWPVYCDDSGIVLWDFTTGLTKYYDPANVKKLEETWYVSKVGDLNQDQNITEIDYQTWKEKAMLDLSGCHKEDLNFDNRIDTKDYVLWYNNKINTP